jgi:hypothetical protein
MNINNIIYNGNYVDSGGGLHHAAQGSRHRLRLHFPFFHSCLFPTQTGGPDLRATSLNAVVIIIINCTLRATAGPVVKERFVLRVNAGVR